MKHRYLSCIAFLLALIMLSFTACDSGTRPDDQTVSTTAPDSSSDTTTSAGADNPETLDVGPTKPEKPDNMLTVIADGKAYYSVIRPDKASEDLKVATTEFKKQLSETYGKIQITYETDWVKTAEQATNDDPEILVGLTNRPESAEITGKLSEGQFAVAAVGEKIVICGYDDEATIRALDLFINCCAVTADSLTVEKSMNLVGMVTDPPQFTSSVPDGFCVYELGKKLDFSASFASAKPIVTGECSVLIDGVKATNTNWYSNKVTFSATGLGRGRHIITVILKNKAGGINVLRREFEIASFDTLNIYRGEVHSHTTVSDGKGGKPADAFKYARDVGGVDFFAVTDHDYAASRSGFFNQVIPAAELYNKPGEFVAIYGYEVTYFANGFYGHYNVLNTQTYIETTGNKLTSIYKQVAGLNEAVGQFNHPCDEWGNFNDFGYYSEEADKATSLIEIWGAAYEQHYALALAKGWHISPVFNEDTHDATWTTKYEALTCVLAPELTREYILDAMRSNRTYMTEDKELKIFFKANDQWLGSILTDPEKLDITVDLSTTSPTGIGTVSLITEDRIVVAKVNVGKTQSYQWHLTIDDPIYDYYYIQVKTPKYAVTAPIWIEHTKPVVVSDLTQSLLTGTSSAADHIVTAKIRNTSKKDMTDVTVSFYQTAETGFVLDNTTPTSVVRLGTVKAGTTVDASAAFDYDTTGIRRVTAIVSGKIDGVNYGDTAYTLLSNVYITEILAAPFSYNGVKDPFAYIEIYNNSNENLDLSNYSFRLWPDVNAIDNGKLFTQKLSGTVKPHSTAVIWFKPYGNPLTVADFNKNFGTKLVEGSTLTIVQCLQNKTNTLNLNNSVQIDIAQLAYTISRAQYNWGDALGELTANKSMVYSYPHFFTYNTEKVTSRGEMTPGVIDASQVPALMTSSEWNKLTK